MSSKIIVNLPSNAFPSIICLSTSLFWTLTLMLRHPLCSALHNTNLIAAAASVFLFPWLLSFSAQDSIVSCDLVLISTPIPTTAGLSRVIVVTVILFKLWSSCASFPTSRSGIVSAVLKSASCLLTSSISNQLPGMPTSKKLHLEFLIVLFLWNSWLGEFITRA